VRGHNSLSRATDATLVRVCMDTHTQQGNTRVRLRVSVCAHAFMHVCVRACASAWQRVRARACTRKSPRPPAAAPRQADAPAPEPAPEPGPEPAREHVSKRMCARACGTCTCACVCASKWASAHVRGRADRVRGSERAGVEAIKTGRWMRLAFECTRAHTRVRRQGRHACENASIVVRRGDEYDQRPVLELYSRPMLELHS
jgi:hypothetical protein